MTLDENDFKILELLKEDSSLTTSQISKKINVPITTVHNRIKKLKEMKVIDKFTIKINNEKIGKGLSAHILLTVNQNLPGKKISQQEIGRKIKAHDNVESVDIVTGTTDMVVKVRFGTMNELNDFITKDLRKIEGVDKTQTMMVLEEI